MPDVGAGALCVRAPSGDEVAFEPARLVVAGYTGRDAAAVADHVRELAAAGIEPPPRVPTYFELPPELVACDEVAVVDGARTSGEVEPVLLFTDAGILLTVGSDHTDRDIERDDVARSKAACPKPIAPQALDYGEVVRDWDRCTLRSWAEDDLYQEGALGSITPPPEILDDFGRVMDGPRTGLVLFLGTIPLRVGGFRFAEAYRMSLSLPSGRSTELNYRVARRA